jgi:hypothetical protein
MNTPLRRGAVGSLGLAALTALFAMTATPASATIVNEGKWKVVGGHLEQWVTWDTVSQSDDGCYLTTFRDNGKDDMSYQAVRGRKVEFTKPLRENSNFFLNDPHNGILFRGSDQQHSHYSLSPHRDHPGDQCGPYTQKPPDTGGCGTWDAAKADLDLFVDDKQQVNLDGPISDPAYFDFNCPSDDSLSTVVAPSPGGSFNELNKGDDKVHFEGADVLKSPKYVNGPGYDEVNDNQKTNIDWALTLKRVR